MEEAFRKISPEKIDLISVTTRPGLLGSLLTGVTTAQALSLSLKKPLIGVNHIESHIYSPLLFKKEKKNGSSVSSSWLCGQWWTHHAFSL